MILHPPLEELVRGEMGFTNDFIRGRMLQGALNGVANSPAPEYGTPWFTTWAIRYCELQIILNADEWAELEAVFQETQSASRAVGRGNDSDNERCGMGHARAGT